MESDTGILQFRPAEAPAIFTPWLSHAGGSNSQNPVTLLRPNPTLGGLRLKALRPTRPSAVICDSAASGRPGCSPCLGASAASVFLKRYRVVGRGRERRDTRRGAGLLVANGSDLTHRCETRSIPKRIGPQIVNRFPDRPGTADVGCLPSATSGDEGILDDHARPLNAGGPRAGGIARWRRPPAPQAPVSCKRRLASTESWRRLERAWRRPQDSWLHRPA